jgi:hypothetical protein
MSARSRTPLTGRTNLHQSSQVESSGTKWNDPLMFHRPFSPKDPFIPDIQATTPILPKSIYPTIPEFEPVKDRRLKSCPEEWIEKSKKPQIFERSSKQINLTQEEKIEHCKDFIERNRSQLWKYDPMYAKKTPRTLCNSIVEDSNYLGIMVGLHTKEKAFTLGCSDAVKECISTARSHVRISDNDPFATSITTARESRDNRRVQLLTSARFDVDHDHRRGYNHTPEYGNFSKYNGVLKNNQAAVLKR